jgi:hypothetical protein
MGEVLLTFDLAKARAREEASFSIEIALRRFVIIKNKRSKR